MGNKRRVLLKYPIIYIYIYISKVNGRTNWLTRDGCNCRDVNFNRCLKKKKELNERKIHTQREHFAINSTIIGGAKRKRVLRSKKKKQR